MGDLVERLDRNAGWRNERWECITDPSLLKEAAAEITRLTVALFKPCTAYTAVRAHAAGTKVVYTDLAGNQVTCWAEDWTRGDRRISAIMALRARAAIIQAASD